MQSTIEREIEAQENILTKLREKEETWPGYEAKHKGIHYYCLRTLQSILPDTEITRELEEE